MENRIRPTGRAKACLAWPRTQTGGPVGEEDPREATESGSSVRGAGFGRGAVEPGGRHRAGREYRLESRGRTPGEGGDCQNPDGAPPTRSSRRSHPRRNLAPGPSHALDRGGEVEKHLRARQDRLRGSRHEASSWTIRMWAWQEGMTGRHSTASIDQSTRTSNGRSPHRATVNGRRSSRRPFASPAPTAPRRPTVRRLPAPPRREAGDTRRAAPGDGWCGSR